MLAMSSTLDKTLQRSTAKVKTLGGDDIFLTELGDTAKDMVAVPWMWPLTDRICPNQIEATGVQSNWHCTTSIRYIHDPKLSDSVSTGAFTTQLFCSGGLGQFSSHLQAIAARKLQLVKIDFPMLALLLFYDLVDWRPKLKGGAQPL